MLFNESSDIALQLEPSWASAPVSIDLVHLKGGKLLAISPSAMRLYASAEYLHDPFGNGLIDSCDWSEQQSLQQGPSKKSEQPSFVQDFKAGAIHLQQGYTLLVTPVAIQLFASAAQALHNQGCLAELRLE